MKLALIVCVALLGLGVCGATRDAIAAEKGVRVTVDNFNRAETDMYFARFVKESGIGAIQHERELAAIDHQTVVRLNRDTLYSFGTFDLDAAPAIFAA